MEIERDGDEEGKKKKHNKKMVRDLSSPFSPSSPARRPQGQHHLPPPYMLRPGKPAKPDEIPHQKDFI
ncbi:hypothetical protein L249_2115 [Ophiocordyceps polyrhachis-furcata BCC 54312]|uniref:Uncharacterized protein n=1 Tax=Ophiocordyceps polyrhachis-furcata BCC 54312 TaxID=1330021 RepID=A0A367LP27_9HYPO|nr:hypothetical protein L249_2115 [Ophiocordyceps polyrhachis-furcata BCC 54312]